MLKLSELIKHCWDLPIELQQDITGLSLDSRQVQAGDLFFAYPGTYLDGRNFIQEAIQKGAHAVLSEVKGEMQVIWEEGVPVIAVPDLQQKLGQIAAKFYGYPANDMQIIGVTGTNGKTSCTHFIAAVLQQLDIPCGVIGTLGSGLYGQIQAGNLTTPDAVTLHKTFAKLRDQGAKAVAMEVSSHSLDQGRVNGIDFAVGVFTNLTRDHLDYHGNMQAYGQAKQRLFNISQQAVINIDDAFGQTIFSTLKAKKNAIPYGLTHAEGVYADTIKLDVSGMSAHIKTPWGQGNLHTKLIGKFNLSNILAALSTLCLLNVPLEATLTCIETLSAVPGRMQALGGEEKPLVIVDYSHTPDALEKALTAVRQHCHGKLFCVFGCGGDRDKGKRPLMAKIAEKYADQVIVTDDNPRTEKATQIVADILQGFERPTAVTIQHDRSKAIRDVIQYAKSGDCILVAGKGAETYQLVGEQKLPFSDIEQVRESLAC